jgi:5-oxoprolinase (ATP-hydrolysing) subunit B
VNLSASITPRRCGDRGWLVDIMTGAPGDWADVVRAQSWAAQLLEDVVPSDTSVLVVARPGSPMDEVNRRITSVSHPDHSGTQMKSGRRVSRTLTIPVRYDGCDLPEVAGRLGLSERRVIELHTGVAYTVGFFGFAPGFAYLRGLPGALCLPRRVDPRTRVDAGAVAIANAYSVIYPGHTPGGWHVIGTTTEVLWDPDVDPPNRLTVGDAVRFENAT